MLFPRLCQSFCGVCVCANTSVYFMPHVICICLFFRHGNNKCPIVSRKTKYNSFSRIQIWTTAILHNTHHRRTAEKGFILDGRIKDWEESLIPSIFTQKQPNNIKTFWFPKYNYNLQTCNGIFYICMYTILQYYITIRNEHMKSGKWWKCPSAYRPTTRPPAPGPLRRAAWKSRTEFITGNYVISQTLLEIISGTPLLYTLNILRSDGFQVYSIRSGFMNVLYIIYCISKRNDSAFWNELQTFLLANRGAHI